MKKILSVVMALIITASMTGCATSNQKPAETASPAAETSAETVKPQKETGTKAAAEETKVQAEVQVDAAGEYAVAPRKITDRTLKVALIPITMNTAYSMTINGAKKEIEEKGYDMELIVQAPSSNTSSLTEQVNIIENMIQQGVDAIALSTESDESMLPYLRAAAEADIPVFLFNMTELNKDNIYYVSSIGYDQYKAGYDLGQWVAETYKDEDVKLAMLEGYAGIVNSYRIDGFNDAIKDSSNITTVVSQTADWTREKGQSVTESILTAHPDINLLVGVYDEMVLGGMAVVKERKLQDQIDIVGYGCSQDGVAAIERGEMKASIDVSEYGTGRDIIDAVHAYCVEGVTVDKVINRPSAVFDTTNISEFDKSVFEGL